MDQDNPPLGVVLTVIFAAGMTTGMGLLAWLLIWVDVL
jgi:hypothetical protein